MGLKSYSYKLVIIVSKVLWHYDCFCIIKLYDNNSNSPTMQRYFSDCFVQSFLHRIAPSTKDRNGRHQKVRKPFGHSFCLLQICL